MKCRGLQKDSNKYNVVWFGSYGVDILRERQEIILDPTSSDSISIPKSTMVNQKFFIIGKNESDNQGILKFQKQSSDIEVISIDPGPIYLTGLLNDEVDSISMATPIGSGELTIIFEQYGAAKKYQSNSNNINYNEGRQAVIDSLIQRLSIIKKELWYDITYGLPLLDKVKNKYLIDSKVISIITDHPDVDRITTFKSSVDNHNYTCDIKILSKFGEININL